MRHAETILKLSNSKLMINVFQSDVQARIGTKRPHMKEKQINMLMNKTNEISENGYITGERKMKKRMGNG